MLYTISYYLVIGACFTLITELVLKTHKDESLHIKTNQERVYLILVWPIGLLMVIGSLIKILIDGPDEDDFKNLR